MNTRIVSKILAGALLLAILQAGCAPTAQNNPTPPVESPLPPTATVSPSPTATPTPPPIPPSATLVDQPRVVVLQMLDEQNGWGVLDTDPDSRLAAVGRTTDGGLTWYDVTPAEAEAFTEDDTFFFLDNRAAWLLLPNENGTSSLYSTNDGGASWAISSAVPFYVGPMGELSFMDNSHGWALVHSFIDNIESVAVFKTLDGGQTWQQVYSNDPVNPVGGAAPSSPQNPLHITFIDAQKGWLSGTGEASVGLYITLDGGATWTQQDLELPSAQARHTGIHLIAFDRYSYTQAGQVVCFNQNDCIVPVVISDNDGNWLVFYVSHDGGQTWTPSTKLEYTGDMSCSVTSVNDIVVWDGGHTIFSTSDGGQTWNQTYPDTIFGGIDSATPGDLTGIQFVNATTGFATVDGYEFEGDQMIPASQVWMTTDGGATWEKIQP